MLHNGIYTITNTETGEHRTFKISTQSNDSKFAPGKRTVALLAGPDNDHDYQGFGFVYEQPALVADNADALPASRITVWQSKRGNSGKRSAWEFYAALLSLFQFSRSEDEEVSATATLYGRTYSVRLSKRCCRCNRRLTTPESIALGIGPICAERAW